VIEQSISALKIETKKSQEGPQETSVDKTLNEGGKWNINGKSRKLRRKPFM